MIEIDGSEGEGGGQIIRTALALSALTGKAFRVINIRANRPDPGLKAQHVKSAEAAAQLCNGTLDGCFVRSKEFTFYPRKLQGRKLDIDIGTAGSITLLLQSIMLPAMFAEKPSRFLIKGGTNVAWSMPIEYLQEVLVPHLRRWANIDIKLIRRGYFPSGNGSVEVNIKPVIMAASNTLLGSIVNQIRKIDLSSQGALISIKGVFHASKTLEADKIAEKMSDSCKDVLKKLGIPIDFRLEYNDTSSPGAGCTIWCICSINPDDIDFSNPIMIGADCLLERGMTAEETGKKAAVGLLEELKSKAPVDKYLADNLVPFAAIASPSKYLASEITEHTRTNIAITEMFLGKKFNIKDNIIEAG